MEMMMNSEQAQWLTGMNDTDNSEQGNSNIVKVTVYMTTIIRILEIIIVIIIMITSVLRVLIWLWI